MELIDEALHRKKRNRTWLAKQLGIGVAAIGQWDKRGVPAKQTKDIARLLELTRDQIEGDEAAPWAKDGSWPFPDAELLTRIERLTRDQKVEIQGKLRDVVKEYENKSTKQSGELGTLGRNQG